MSGQPFALVVTVATIRMWCSLFCETCVTIQSRRNTTTLRSIGTTRTPSPRDLMTRLSQRGRFFPRLPSPSFVTRCHFDVLVSSHFTLHRVQMSHVNKKSMKQGRRAQKFMSRHWWTSVIWRMLNWRQSTKSTKVELYSEATLWKMILNLMQCSLNKDHQHHKWQQQKSWISYPDCRVAMDKQLTQYLLIPK